ncbi:MAG: M56 family metallopeptidase [Lachnospiraceae bacterium]|nr:M56 family metallopeptidase [Lachnospiraceae bacterium]
MIETIISSSVLILALIIIRSLFRGKISHRLQYALWGIVLLRLFMPFSLFSSSLSVANIFNNTFSVNTLYSLSEDIKSENETISEKNSAALSLNNTYSSALQKNSYFLSPQAGSISLSFVLKLIWFLGSVVFSIWFIYVNLSFYIRLKKMRVKYNYPGNLPVYMVKNIASPCLFGIIRPSVYITKPAAESRFLDNIITHELCHYRHKDNIWAIFRCICIVIYWWNPFVWAAAMLSREDAELACDESVIAKTGENNRISYGHTLWETVNMKEQASGIICCATTMVSDKKAIKKRLGFILKKQNHVIWAAITVLLTITLCIGCTFTGSKPDDEAAIFPETEMFFSSENKELSQIGQDAACSYYSQFAKDDTPKYWHITKYEVLASEAVAGDETEFAVWVTCYIETDGAGFLIGQGIPSDENDISKGGVCPEVSREFRIKSLGENEYEIISIGTGGGTSGLSPLDSKTSYNVSYSLKILNSGNEILTSVTLSGDEEKLASEIIMSYMVKSAAFPGVDINSINKCYVIRATYEDDSYTDFYAYESDGKAVMQSGETGYYSIIDPSLFEELEKLSEIKLSSSAKNLDYCVSQAILNENSSNSINGDLATESHVILTTSESGDYVIVYTMAMFMEFGYAGSGFFETGGNHMPVAITFLRKPTGEYELYKYWVPKDGSYYADSIRRVFPAEIYNDAIDTQKYVLSQIQACYKSAIEYGNVNTDYNILKLIETITSSPKEVSNPYTYIEAHEIQYRELLYYGDYTLKYIFKQFIKGGQNGLNGNIMLFAMRELLGNEDTDFTEAYTAQKWFDNWDSYISGIYAKEGAAYMETNLPKSLIYINIKNSAS